MGEFFHLLIIDPIYNTLVTLVNILPGHSLGLAVIILTIIIKIILFPVSHKSFKTQRGMRKIQPEIDEIKAKFKNDNQTQAVKILELYRKHGISPFSSILLLLIQIPVFISLYWVFRNLIPFTPENLYPFVELPVVTKNVFLGLFDLTERSLILAIFAGVGQFIQAQLLIPPVKKDKSTVSSFSSDFARGMNTNIRYVMPIFIIFIAYSLPSVIALYFIVNSIYSIGHEYLIKRKAETILKEGGEGTTTDSIGSPTKESVAK